MILAWASPFNGQLYISRRYDPYTGFCGRDIFNNVHFITGSVWNGFSMKNHKQIKKSNLIINTMKKDIYFSFINVFITFRHGVRHK